MPTLPQIRKSFSPCGWIWVSNNDLLETNVVLMTWFRLIKKWINGTLILISRSWDWSLTHYSIARRCLWCVCWMFAKCSCVTEHLTSSLPPSSLSTAHQCPSWHLTGNVICSYTSAIPRVEFSGTVSKQTSLILALPFWKLKSQQCPFPPTHQTPNQLPSLVLFTIASY